MKKLTILLVAALTFTLSYAEVPADTYVEMVFGGVDTLDPEGAYDTSSGSILENIYETLYTYDGTSIQEFKPALATDYTVSADEKTYTFTLREGVKFHSGNDFSCKDVEYSLERVLVMNDSQSGVWFQSEAFLGAENHGSNANNIVAEQATAFAAENNIDTEADDFDSMAVEGFDYDAAYAAIWQMIDEAIECADDFTVIMTLPAVDPAFFSKLIYTNASIIDSQWAIDNGEWSGTEGTWREWIDRDPRAGYLHNHASGTGAYKLIQWDGQDVTAEAFADYWGGEPTIKTVLIQKVEEESSRILALQNGDADRITVNDWASLENQVRGLEGVTIHEDPSWTSLGAGSIHLNQATLSVDNSVNIGSGQLDGKGIPSDFFSDINVRKGFAYSFDPQIIIEELYLGKGSMLTMALPPSFLGYDETVPTYHYDPEKAEEFFCAAFDGTLCDIGFEMTISYNSGNTTRQTIAEIFKANIEDLNPKFKINLRGIAWPDFLADRKRGALPVSIVGWAPDYADPDNFMYTFYHSNGYYGGQMNFVDEQIDQWLTEARQTTDAATRELLYSSVANRAYDLAPTIVYPTRLTYMVTSDKLQGVYRNPMLSGGYLWKDIYKN